MKTKEVRDVKRDVNILLEDYFVPKEEDLDEKLEYITEESEY